MIRYKSGLNGYVYGFSVDYNTTDASDIVDIHKYSMKKKQHTIMFKVIKQALIALLSFSGSLAHQAKVSEGTECVSLNNESCIARPKLNELNQEELFYYPHMVRLDRYSGSCNSLDDLSSGVCILNKIRYNAFDLITKISYSMKL